MATTLHQELDPTRVIETIGELADRIERRFSESGLTRLCRRLQAAARHARFQSVRLAQRALALRIGIGLLITSMAALFAMAIIHLPLPEETISLFDFVELLEAALNDLVLIGLAVFFFATLERRIKRGRALRALHELRAIAHLIDLHQLSKRPDRQLWQAFDEYDEVLPGDDMSAFELSRYLHYCSEMLSLTGKVAVIYVREFDDAVVLSAVNEIESLTTGLAGRIWQKLVTLESLVPRKTPGETMEEGANDEVVPETGKLLPLPQQPANDPRSASLAAWL